jgi:ABC-type dipeptide/oligopeptide/nickel transport system permease component
MAGYVARRVLLVVPVVFGALSLLFVAFFVLPGDEARLIAGGGDRPIPAARVEQIREAYDLDEPLVVQYARYWGRTVQGDFGESYRLGTPVSDVMGDTAGASLRLAFWAVVIEVVLGVGAGLLSAMRRGTFLDGLVTVSTLAVSAVPVFVLGLVLQQATGVFPNQHDWPAWARLPTDGIGPDSWALGVIPTGDQWQYLVQPAFVLAAVSTAVVARVTRAALVQVRGEPHMRQARAKGFSEWQAVTRYGLRNAMIPVVTLVGLDFGALVGSAVVTEYTFNWPGVGSALADAIDARDAPVILGLSAVVVLVYALVNLATDVVYTWLDPRVRLARERP